MEKGGGGGQCGVGRRVGKREGVWQVGEGGKGR